MANAPGVTIPTGYESLGRDVLLKRKLAEAMMGQDTNYRHGSWTQVLGDLADAWGGRKLEKDASAKEVELNAKIKGDYDTANQELMKALLGDPNKVYNTPGIAPPPGSTASEPIDPVQAALPFANNPLLQNNPVLKALMEGYGERIKNQQGTEGSPQRMRNPQTGQIETVLLDKTGRPMPMGGGYQALPKMTDVNGMAVDMDAQAPGSVLPQNPEALVVRDTPTNANFQVNSPAFATKEALAAAGRTQVQNSTYVDSRDKSFGKVIPQATIDDLTKSRDAAQSFITIAPHLKEAQRATKNMVSGFGANVRLGALRAADLFGIAGKSDQERIANTQTYVRGMGQQMLPILQVMRPASDTDVKIAERMAGGDPSLSLTEIRRATAAAQQAGKEAIGRHRRRVSSLSGEYAGNPELSQGFKTFDVDTADLDAADARQEAIRRELARRKGKR